MAITSIRTGVSNAVSASASATGASFWGVTVTVTVAVSDAPKESSIV